MQPASFHAIVDALAQARVRFILVGGLAVVAHGYLRVTRDADFVIELVPENILSAFEALKRLGYRSTVPITAKEFTDAELRRKWREEKHMQVLQFWSDAHPGTKLGVFIEHPFDFQAEWKVAKGEPTGPHATEIRIATIPTLIAMKEAAGRPQDRIDIQFLRKIQADPQPRATTLTAKTSTGPKPASKAPNEKTSAGGDGSPSTKNSALSKNSKRSAWNSSTAAKPRAFPILIPITVNRTRRQSRRTRSGRGNPDGRPGIPLQRRSQLSVMAPSGRLYAVG